MTLWWLWLWRKRRRHDTGETQPVDAVMQARSHRRWGAIRRLGSGRWQASYGGPDGRRYTAKTDDGRPLTFTSRRRADDYLVRVHADIQRGVWKPPPRKVDTQGGDVVNVRSGRETRQMEHLPGVPPPGLSSSTATAPA